MGINTVLLIWVTLAGIGNVNNVTIYCAGLCNRGRRIIPIAFPHIILNRRISLMYILAMEIKDTLANKMPKGDKWPPERIHLIVKANM